jgi:2Fe-2S ferredoxin
MEMYTIRISFEKDGHEAVTFHEIEPGQSVLEVCLKNNIGLHHKCGGVCSCSTCHLYVLEGQEFLEEISVRESAFIKRAVNPQLNSRLGCQCLLLEDKGRVEVLIPEESGF